MNYLKVRVTILSLLVLVLIVGCSDNSETSNQNTTKLINSKDTKDTQVTSILQDKIPDNKNLIYCSTFQLAWNELMNDIIKAPIRLEKQPPEVNYLNQELVTKNDLSTKNYVAMAGFGRDKIVDKINQELKSKFGDNAELLADEYKGDMVLAYAFLFKQLKFSHQFDALKNDINFYKSNKLTRVSGFGINSDTPSDNFKQVAEQVSIYDYQNPDDFVIKLKTQGENDELVLAKVQPRVSLLDTYQYVQKRIERGPKQSFEHGDMLAIPKMNFKIKHTYENLLKKPFKNKGFEPWQIDEAWQTILFKLNEEGATLKSEALEGVRKSITQQKSLVFDKPYLLYLREANAKYPYLVMWINNPELLRTVN
jgi:hypothetical protein